MEDSENISDTYRFLFGKVCKTIFLFFSTSSKIFLSPVTHGKCTILFYFVIPRQNGYFKILNNKLISFARSSRYVLGTNRLVSFFKSPFILNYLIQVLLIIKDVISKYLGAGKNVPKDQHRHDHKDSMTDIEVNPKNLQVLKIMQVRKISDLRCKVLSQIY